MSFAEIVLPVNRVNEWCYASGWWIITDDDDHDRTQKRQNTFHLPNLTSDPAPNPAPFSEMTVTSWTPNDMSSNSIVDDDEYSFTKNNEEIFKKWILRFLLACWLTGRKEKKWVNELDLLAEIGTRRGSHAGLVPTSTTRALAVSYHSIGGHLTFIGIFRKTWWQ